MNRVNRILLPLGIGTTLSLLGSTTLGVVLPTHAGEVGISLGVVGVLLSATRVTRLLVNGPVGLAYDRWPRRRLLIPALFLGALSTLIFAVTRGFWPFLAGRILWGLAWAGIWVGGTTVIADVTEERERGRWMGLYQVSYSLGLALGMVGGGWLTDRLGFQTAMSIAAAAAALGSLPALLLLPKKTRVIDASPRSTGQADLARYWRALRTANRELWAINALQGVNMLVTFGIVAATVPLLVHELLPSTGLSLGVATVTGLLGATRMALSIAVTPLAGAVSDWLGRRWPVILALLIVGIASLALMAASNLWVAFGGVVLGALVGAGVRTLLAARTADLASPEQRGAAIGVLNVSGDLGSAIGPVLAYALLRWVGLSSLYLGCAGLYGLAAVLVLWIYLQFATTGDS